MLLKKVTLKISEHVKLGISDWVSSIGLWTTFQENVINVIAKNVLAGATKKIQSLPREGNYLRTMFTCQYRISWPVVS